MITLETVRIKIMLRQIKLIDPVSFLTIDNGFIPFHGILGHGIHRGRDPKGPLRGTIQEG